MWYGYCFDLKDIENCSWYVFYFFKFIKKAHTGLWKQMNVILMHCISLIFFKKVFISCFMLKFIFNTLYLSEREYFCLISINVKGCCNIVWSTYVTYWCNVSENTLEFSLCKNILIAIITLRNIKLNIVYMVYTRHK